MIMPGRRQQRRASRPPSSPSPAARRRTSLATPKSSTLAATAAVRQQDVLRLQVAVQHAFAVRRARSPRTPRSGSRIARGGVEPPFALQHVPQILAAHQLHDQVGAAVGERAVVEDRRRSTDAAAARRSAPRAGSGAAPRDRRAARRARPSARPADRAACRARGRPRPCRRVRAAARCGTCCRRCAAPTAPACIGAPSAGHSDVAGLLAAPAPRALHHRLERRRDAAASSRRRSRPACASTRRRSRATSKPSPICAAMLASSWRSSAV